MARPILDCGMYLRTRGVGRNGTGRDGTGALQRATGERWRMSVRGVLCGALGKKRKERREAPSRVHATNATQAPSLHLVPFLSFPFFSLVVMYFLSFFSPSNCRLSSNFLPGDSFAPKNKKMSQNLPSESCLML